MFVNVALLQYVHCFYLLRIIRRTCLNLKQTITFKQQKVQLKCVRGAFKKIYIKKRYVITVIHKQVQLREKDASTPEREAREA